MGMNVTGVNSYATNALPTTAPSYTSKVQASLLAQQPAYDTVSFSGNYQTQQKEKEGMSTGAKVGLVAVAATAVLGIWAASRGKKLNGGSKGLWNNIGAGLKSIFTKAGRESYSALTKNSDKLDDLGKGIIDANGKVKPAREVTDSMLETANKKGIAAQKEVNELQASLKELEALKGTKEAPADLDDQIKKVTEQITQKQKGANSAFKELAELKFDKNMADDVDYAELLKTQERCSTQLTELTGKKTALQKEVDAIKAQREKLAGEIANLKQPGNGTVDDLIKEKEALQTTLQNNYTNKNKELQELSKRVTEARQSSQYATRDIRAYVGAKKGYYFGEAQEGINKTILDNYKKTMDTAVQSGTQQEMLNMLQNNINTSWNGTTINVLDKKSGQTIAQTSDRKAIWEKVKEMIHADNTAAKIESAKLYSL